MQEDIENRTITLAINSSKLTARTLQRAMVKLLAYLRNKKHQHKDVTHHGKQTVKQLVRQNQGVTNVELDEGVKAFERIARKYGVDFAVKRTKGAKSRYLVFFKARDADAITAAMTEYTRRRMEVDQRPSVRKLLEHFQAQTAMRGHEQQKDKELSR